jgi:NADPH:quinone reductase-like Zn-dependent oxidoreductase
VVGEMPDVQPGPGEVRVVICVSGVNPGDLKKRSGWQGSPMPYPRVIPHSDFTPAVKAQAAQQLTAALVEGKLRSVIAERVPLGDIARAHELVERGVAWRVIVTIGDDA